MSDTKLQCRNPQMRFLKELLKDCYELLKIHQDKLHFIDNYFSEDSFENDIEEQVNKIYYYTNLQLNLVEEIKYQLKKIRIISTEISKYTC